MAHPDGEGEVPCPPISTREQDCMDCYGELRGRMEAADARYLHQKSHECMEGRQAPEHTYLYHARAAAGEAVPRRSEFARFVPNGLGAARRSELATHIVMQRNYLAYCGKPLRGGGPIALQPLSALPPAAPDSRTEDEGEEVYFDDEQFTGAEVVFLNGEPHRIANGQRSERALYGVDSPTAAIRAAAAKARSGVAAPSKKGRNSAENGHEAAARFLKQSDEGATAKHHRRSPSGSKAEGDYASNQFLDYVSESGKRYRMLRLYHREVPPLTGSEASQASSRSRLAPDPERKSTKRRGGSGAKAVNRTDGARGARDASRRSKREDSASSPKKREFHAPRKPHSTANVRRSRRKTDRCKHCRRSVSPSAPKSSSPASPTASASGREEEDDDVDKGRRVRRGRRGREDHGHTSPRDELLLPPLKEPSRHHHVQAEPSRCQVRVHGDRKRDPTGRRRGRHQRAHKSEMAPPRSASSTSSSTDSSSSSGNSNNVSSVSDCVVTDEPRRSGHIQRWGQAERPRRIQARRRRHSPDSDEADERRRGSSSGSDASDEDSSSSSPSSSSSSGSGSSGAASVDPPSPVLDSQVRSRPDRAGHRRRHDDRGGRSSRAASHPVKVSVRRGTRDAEPLKATRGSSSDSSEDMHEQPVSPGAAHSPDRRRSSHRSASASGPPVVTVVTAMPPAQVVLAPLRDELSPSMRYASGSASPVSSQSPERPVRDWRQAALGYLNPNGIAPQGQQLVTNPVTGSPSAGAAAVNTTSPRAAEAKQQQERAPSTTSNPLRRSYNDIPLSPLRVSHFHHLSAVSSASSGPVCATPQEDGRHSTIGVQSRQTSRATPHTTNVPAEGPGLDLDLDAIAEHVLRVLQKRIGGGGGYDIEAPDARRARMAAEAEEEAAAQERLRVLAEEAAAAAEAEAKREAAQQQVHHLLHEARNEVQLARDAKLPIGGLTASVAFTLAQVTHLLEDGADLDAHTLPLGLTAHDKDSELTLTNMAASSATHIYGAATPPEAKARRVTSAGGGGAATQREAVLATLNADAAALRRLVTELRQTREHRAEERRVAQAKAVEERRVALEKAAAAERAKEAERAKAEAEAKALKLARQRQYEMEALMGDERRSRTTMVEDEEEAWDEVLVTAASQLDDVMHRIATRQRNARLSLCEEEAGARADIVGAEEDEAGDFWDVAAHLWEAAAEDAEARDQEERQRLQQEAEAATAAWRKEQMAEAERMQAVVRRMETEADPEKGRNGSLAAALPRSTSKVRALRRSNVIPGQIVSVTRDKLVGGGGKIRLVGDPHVEALEARVRERRRAENVRQKRLSVERPNTQDVGRARSGSSVSSRGPPSTVHMGIVGAAAIVAKPKNSVASRNSRTPSGPVPPQGKNKRVGKQPPPRKSQPPSQSNAVGNGAVVQSKKPPTGTPARSRNGVSPPTSSNSAATQAVELSIGTPYKTVENHDVGPTDIRAIRNY